MMKMMNMSEIHLIVYIISILQIQKDDKIPINHYKLDNFQYILALKLALILYDTVNVSKHAAKNNAKNYIRGHLQQNTHCFCVFERVWTRKIPQKRTLKGFYFTELQQICLNKYVLHNLVLKGVAFSLIRGLPFSTPLQVKCIQNVSKNIVEFEGFTVKKTGLKHMKFVTRLQGGNFMSNPLVSELTYPLISENATPSE
ncbi:Hypothetical_protein [Hexamita inflata]|uniref:Hypothetical_protein n=1 Tax=Hexamita inflata TaxID=28002 RepID=A0ABP1HAM3_9EUKA